MGAGAFVICSCPAWPAILARSWLQRRALPNLMRLSARLPRSQCSPALRAPPPDLVALPVAMARFTSGRLTSESFWPLPRHNETKEDAIVLQSTVAPDDQEDDASQGLDGEPAAPAPMKRPAAAPARTAPQPAARAGKLPVMKRPASRLASGATDWAQLPVTKLPVVKSPVLKKPAAIRKKPSAYVEEGNELELGLDSDSEAPPHGGSLPAKKLRALQYFSKFMRGTTPAALAPKKSSPQNLNVDAKLDVA